MKKLLILFFICFLASFAWADEDYISGYKFDNFEIVGYNGMSQPSVSPLGDARIYFDSTDNKLKISENGGAYTNIGTDTFGDGLSVCGTLTVSGAMNVFDNDFRVTDSVLGNSLYFDTSAGDLTIQGAMSATSYTSTGASSRVTGQFGEYIDFDVNGSIGFCSFGGTDDTDLFVDLDGGHPVLYSCADDVIGFGDGIWVCGDSRISKLSVTGALDAQGLCVREAVSAQTYYGDGSNLSGLSSSSIADADDDTKIQTEEGADEDIIRFDVGGNEELTMTGDAINLQDNNYFMHTDITDHYIELVNNDADTGWYWRGAALNRLRYNYNGTAIFEMASNAIYCNKKIWGYLGIDITGGSAAFSSVGVYLNNAIPLVCYSSDEAEYLEIKHDDTDAWYDTDGTNYGSHRFSLNDVEKFTIGENGFCTPLNGSIGNDLYVKEKAYIGNTTTSSKINLGGGLTAFVLNGVSLDAVVGSTSQIATELQYIGIQHSNTAISGSRFMFARSRGTLATPTIVQDGDALAAIDAAAFDGTDYVLAGEIDFEVDGTPGGNDMPGRIVFKTTADGGILPAERMRIDSAGNVGIGLTPTANMAGLSIEDGLLTLKETTTPTADTNYAKIYSKTDNNLYFQDGAGTEHTVLKGAVGTQHAFFTPLEDPTGTVGNWDIIEINAAQSVHFSCQIPEDFESLSAATIVMIPDTTETIQWDINVSVSAAGEAYDNDDRAAADQQLAVTSGNLTEADISGQLTGLSAGDYIAVDFQSDTANLRIVGFEFDWN